MTKVSDINMHYADAPKFTTETKTPAVDLTCVRKLSIGFDKLIDLEHLPSLEQGAESAFALFRALYDDETIQYNECFKALYLTTGHQVVGYVEIASGAINGVAMEISTILAPAIILGAKNVIISHNHPSGKTNPSHADIKLTRKVKEACDAMNVKLLDHLIICNTRYYSFASEGLVLNEN